MLSILSLILLPCQQIEQMSFPYMHLGPETSRHFATVLFTMPNLRTVDMSVLGLDDSFFLVMSELVQKSQVRTKRWCTLQTHTRTTIQSACHISIGYTLYTAYAQKIKLIKKHSYRICSKHASLKRQNVVV